MSLFHISMNGAVTRQFVQRRKPKLVGNRLYRNMVAVSRLS